MGGPAPHKKREAAWRDPLRASIAQQQSDADARRLELQAQPPDPHGVRFLALGRRSDGAFNTSGRDTVVFVAKLAATLKPMHAGHYATGVRTIFEAPATLAALAVQPRIYVTDDELGTINIESGGSGELVYVAVSAPGYPQAMAFSCLGELRAQVDAHFQGWDEARVAAQKCRWRARVPERDTRGSAKLPPCQFSLSHRLTLLPLILAPQGGRPEQGPRALPSLGARGVCAAVGRLPGGARQPAVC